MLQNKPFDGKKAEIFALGVTLFITVLGTFPFESATKSDYYYRLMLTGNLSKYWQIFDGSQLSLEFKDLILKMLSYDPDMRPSVHDIENHPWT